MVSQQWFTFSTEGQTNGETAEMRLSVLRHCKFSVTLYSLHGKLHASFLENFLDFSSLCEKYSVKISSHMVGLSLFIKK